MRHSTLLVALILASHAAIARADGHDVQSAISCKPIVQVKFAEGETSAHFDGSLQRWQQACFSFAAKKGQRVDIELVDANQSATIAVYEPGYSIDYGNTTQDGHYTMGWGDTRIPLNTYRGSTLTQPLEAQTAPVQSYRGRLPQTGDYLIVVELSASGASTFGGRLSIR